MPQRFRSTLVVSCVVALVLIATARTQAAAQEGVQRHGVRLHDDRLALTLFAEDPQIVTPIGMAIDSEDQVFVLESHTHHPAPDYEGPEGDRVKIFRDVDDDGRADEVRVFAEGIHQGMNLAFSPDGVLYVVCSRQVLKLHDTDGDGVCDQQHSVLRLVTKERYAHSCLLGITFDNDGWMYVSRGNTGSHGYRFEGSDDSSVSGYGDGGSVVRCRPDGSQIEPYATGFWNPFDLKFDSHGRLLLVDNDPDARGPNRLVQVVRGGDYGFKAMYGGSGTHPFQGWDGSLPGTLPMISGLGEAPSGVIDCRRSSLPVSYADSILATIWNENTIERVELGVDGATLTSRSRTVFMSGGNDFRPVAIDCDSRGNLFVTDWVLVDYPNHGRGRIWRVATDAESETLSPRKRFASALADPIAKRLRVIERLSADRLVTAASQGDPIERHTATQRLAEESMKSTRQAMTKDHRASVRLAGLLATRLAEPEHPNSIRTFLSDPDPQVRR
ncbi:MAG: PVC-type heme-binding CxxCH protein, partial [Planctomycetota bacterium]